MIGQVERILELQKLQQRDKKIFSDNIFSFTSGKGGTGKTFISLNTAFALSEKGNKVLFIDYDLNFSNSNILLNISPYKTLIDFYSGRSSFEEVLFNYNENLDFLFGDSGKFEDNVNIKFSDILNELKKKNNYYDFILIDTSAGLTNESLDVLLNSNYNIVVSSPEPTAVMDAYVIVKSLKRNHFKGVIAALINKCNKYEDGVIAFNNLNGAVTHFLKDKIDLISILDFDQNVQKSIIEQELYLNRYKESAVANQILELAGKLTEIKQVANIPQIKKF